jgi:hypothetical protein
LKKAEIVFILILWIRQQHCFLFSLMVFKFHVFLEKTTTSQCHSLCMMKFAMWFQSLISSYYSLKKNMEIELEMVLDLQLRNVQHDPPPTFTSLHQTFFVFLFLWRIKFLCFFSFYWLILLSFSTKLSSFI